jgi:hypothetical protein
LEFEAWARLGDAPFRAVPDRPRLNARFPKRIINYKQPGKRPKIDSSSPIAQWHKLCQVSKWPELAGTFIWIHTLVVFPAAIVLKVWHRYAS